MSEQSRKSSKTALLRQITGSIATIDELRRLPKMIAGYLLAGGLPERMADAVFDRLVRRRLTEFNAHLDQDVTVERMKVLLDGHCSDLDIQAYAE